MHLFALAPQADGSAQGCEPPVSVLHFDLLSSYTSLAPGLMPLLHMAPPQHQHALLQLVVGQALRALAITASSYTSGVHWTFCQTRHGDSSKGWNRPGRRADFQPITIEHLMASSCTPKPRRMPCVSNALARALATASHSASLVDIALTD